MKEYIPILILVAILLLLGQYKSKIALGISAIILLGAVIFNGDKLKNLLQGGGQKNG